MSLRRNVRQKADDLLTRIERLANSIGPLQDELHRQTSKVAPLLTSDGEITRLVNILNKPTGPRAEDAS
jgi:hypothetical protein